MNRTLSALLLVAASAIRLQSQPVRVAVSAASRITVSGTSNVHDWKCSTSTIGAAITVRPAAGELASRVESISLKIPVKSLDCGIGQMNTNLAKAMHADKHPTIGFRMNSYSARAAGGGAYQATVNGSLTINGVTRPVTMNTTAQPNANGSVRAVGSTSFSTRTFGVEPVKALLGTIKTGENVTIQIAIVATAPPSVVAAQAAAAVKAVAKPAAKPAVKAVAAVPRAVGTVAPRAPAAVVTQAVPVVRDTVVAVVSVPAPVAPAPVRVVDSVVVQEVAGDIAVVDSAAAPEASAPVADGAVMSAADSARRFAMPAIRIQHARPRDQRGVHLFEAPKQDTVSYNGFTMQWGAAFTQEGQRLEHRNQAQPVMVAGVDQNQLMTIGGGFNNAVANLYLDVQLARGIRVALTSYLSSRHHSETWVKDGYFLIDASPIEHPLLDMLMQLATVKIGHFEVNYGDAHFRRTDNGQAMHNPLIGNLILDGFTTEIGAEGYMRLGPVLAMAGLTGGEIRGQVTGPERRSPAWLGKLGYDRNVTPELRVRLTASTYGSAKARSSTLYTGDRGGSPYFMVIENTLATETANAWSGNIRPGFANVVHAYMLNPFLKFHGLEFFGTIETATGKASAELRKRTVRQLAGEGIMRFGSHEQLYVAGRYNRVAGQLPGIAADISTNRWQAGGGWFLLPTVLAKVEYVIQRYHDFPVTDIRNGARFNGIMVAGALAF